MTDTAGRMNTADMKPGTIVWTRRLDWYDTDVSGDERYGASRVRIGRSMFALVRVARKPGNCQTCRARIEQGDIYGSTEFGSMRWCAGCLTPRAPLAVVAPIDYREPCEVPA